MLAQSERSSKPGSPFPPLSVSSDLPILPLSALTPTKFAQSPSRAGEVSCAPRWGGRGQPQSSPRLRVRARRVSTPSPVCASVHPAAAVCPRPWRSCWCSPSWDWGWHSSGITGLLICELGCSPPLYCLSYPLARPGSLPPHPPLPSWLQALRKSEGKCRMYIPKRFHKYATFPNHLITLAYGLGERLRRRLPLV